MSNYRPDVRSRRRRSPEDVVAAVDVDGFDWDAFQGSYKGRALITRLAHIPNLLLSPTSNPSPNSLSLARAALIRLIPLIKYESWDHYLYLVSVMQVDESLHPERRAFRKQQSSSKKNDHLDENETLDAADDRDIHGSEGPSGMDIDVAMFRKSGKGKEQEGDPDIDWVEEARESERKESSRLDVELRGYMSNLIKESIRLTYLASAQLAVKVGSIQNAMKNFAAVREYSTSPQHHVDLGVAILETCLAFNLPTGLPGHISKLEATLDRLHPPIAGGTSRGQAAEASMTASDLRWRRENEAKSVELRRSVTLRIRVAKGLVALNAGDWTRAGRELGEIGEEGGLGDWEGKAISSADLALITAFCTLATSDRDRIRRLLLDRPSFRLQVDDGEVWLLDLIRAFVEAKYGDVMILLRKAEPILLLNSFLSPHTQILINLIQTRAVVQYVRPFSTVQIKVMAQAFGLDEGEMLALVETLVMDGDIKGRIDVIDKVLELNAPDHRGQLFDNAHRVGQKTTDLTQAAVFRMKLIEAGLIVDPRPKKEDQGLLDVGETDVPGAIPDEGIDEALVAGTESGAGSAATVTPANDAIDEMPIATVPQGQDGKDFDTIGAT